MNYQVEFENEAWEFLQKLPDDKRLEFERAIEDLEQQPFPGSSKRLKGLATNGLPVYRLRRGDYRILYTVENNILLVVIVKIGNRKEVYKKKK